MAADTYKGTHIFLPLVAASRFCNHLLQAHPICYKQYLNTTNRHISYHSPSSVCTNPTSTYLYRRMLCTLSLRCCYNSFKYAFPSLPFAFIIQGIVMPYTNELALTLFHLLNQFLS